MTRRPRSPGYGAVYWLTAQTLVFGVVAAVLGVVANAMFLEAYGATWLPLTYVVIGVAGVGLSTAVAASARRFDLVRVAVVVLGAAAALLGGAWAVAAGGDGAWVSGPLLVLFPLLIQLGFVFVGAQAGRLLDIAGIKARFPRIMAGFPVGAVLGGLLAARLVEVFGSTVVLLLATASAQAVFAVLVFVTGVRYSSFLAIQPGPAPDEAPDADPEVADDPPPMRRLLADPFVRLIFGYQILSAVASQLSDYLVFDRAAAQYAAAEDLARFLAVYTAAMNVASIAFLVLMAGPLMRRFGLRLGISANPVVLTVGAFVMVVMLSLTGAASFALLITVSAVRILDIALTDGTTRTSINAMYQILPPRTRLAAQTTIEGMGVPLAIAVSGVLVFALNALPSSLTALVWATLLVCALWVWVGVVLHRAYGPALLDALRQPRLLGAVPLEGTHADIAEVERLVGSPDPRSARLGLELLSVTAAPVLPELHFLVDDPRAEVRLTALHALAESGDVEARTRLAEEARQAVVGPDPAARVRAALATGLLSDVDRRGVLGRLVEDESPEVRATALDAVRAGDQDLAEAVVRAVDDPLTAVAAAGAFRRLGDEALPVMDQALQRADADEPESRTSRRTVRLLRAVGTGTDASDSLLLQWVTHHDREVGRVVLERLARSGPAPASVARVIDDVLADDLAHAVRILTGVTVLARDRPDTAPGELAGSVSADGDAPLRRALLDELDLVRDRVIAGLIARHGRDRLEPVAAKLLRSGGPDPLALEALEVVLGSSAAARVAPVLDSRDAVDLRLRRLLASSGAAGREGGVLAVLTDLVEDPSDVWRSVWVRACAVRAACERRVVTGLDLTPVRGLGDPMVDEELQRIP